MKFSFICIAAMLIAFTAMIVTVQAFDEEMAQLSLRSNRFMEQRRFLRSLDEDDEYTPQAGVGTVGVVDFSSYLSVGTLQCLRNQGLVAAIPRGYQSVGRVDPNMVANVANARAAGFEYVDVYMFPRPTAGNPAQQVDELWNAFSNHKVNVGMVWIDIEGAQYWTSNVNTNMEFLKGLLSRFNTYNAKVGIYSSKYMWSSIFGSLSSPFLGPLWYAHYDNKASCSDFVSFAGWSKPTLKQYIGDTTLCSAGIDISSYC